jgi:hypothetical protein
MSRNESNTVEQLILDALENLARPIALEPLRETSPSPKSLVFRINTGDLTRSKL